MNVLSAGAQATQAHHYLPVLIIYTQQSGFICLQNNNLKAPHSDQGDRVSLQMR